MVEGSNLIFPNGYLSGPTPLIKHYLFTNLVQWIHQWSNRIKHYLFTNLVLNMPLLSRTKDLLFSSGSIVLHDWINLPLSLSPMPGNFDSSGFKIYFKYLIGQMSPDCFSFFKL